MTNKPKLPSQTKAYKERQMLLRALSSASSRAEKLAKTDHAFQIIADQAHEAWMNAIIALRKIDNQECDAWITAIEAHKAGRKDEQ